MAANAGADRRPDAVARRLVAVDVVEHRTGLEPCTAAGRAGIVGQCRCGAVVVAGLRFAGAGASTGAGKRRPMARSRVVGAADTGGDHWPGAQRFVPVVRQRNLGLAGASGGADRPAAGAGRRRTAVARRAVVVQSAARTTRTGVAGAQLRRRHAALAAATLAGVAARIAQPLRHRPAADLGLHLHASGVFAGAGGGGDCRLVAHRHSRNTAARAGHLRAFRQTGGGVRSWFARRFALAVWAEC